MFIKIENEIVANSKFRLLGVYDDWEGFRILIENLDNNSILGIYFDEIFSYQVTNESYKLSYFPEVSVDKGLLYVSTNSDYIRQLNHESQGIYENEIINHFLILTGEYLIEVLTLEQLVIKEL